MSGSSAKSGYPFSDSVPVAPPSLFGRKKPGRKPRSSPLEKRTVNQYACLGRRPDRYLLTIGAVRYSVISMAPLLEVNGVLGKTFSVLRRAKDSSAIFSFECHISGVHAGGFMKGISGCQNEGAYSIVLSGGYEDDIDLGETLCESFVLVASLSGSFPPCAVHTLDQVGDIFF
jgi:hypothetical protein